MKSPTYEELIERVNDLEKTVDKLKKSENMLKDSEQKLSIIMNNSPDIIYTLDSTGNITYINSTIVKYGFSPEKLIGTNIFNLVHPDDKKTAKYKVNERRSGKRSTKSFEFRIVTKKQENISLEIKSKILENVFQISATGQYQTVHPGKRKFLGTMGIARDITSRVFTEEQLVKSLKEKEVLLREIHHRVKNNLQIVASLLRLQSNYINDAQALELIKESQGRIKSMALVHEKLYRSDDLANIDFHEYIKSLLQYLFSTYKLNSEPIGLKLEIKEIKLGVDTAIPCGLIINELVSNSLKHAFPIDKKAGVISISFDQKKNMFYEIIIKDDGVGVPDDLDFKNTESLGLQLVNTLVKQIQGTIRLNHTHGTEFIIKFKEIN